MRSSVSKLVRIERPTWATARSIPAFSSARPSWYWRSKISSIMVLILSSSFRSKGQRQPVLVVGRAKRGLDQGEAVGGVECAPGSVRIAYLGSANGGSVLDEQTRAKAISHLASPFLGPPLERGAREGRSF